MYFFWILFIVYDFDSIVNDMDWDYGFFVYSVIFFEIVFEINVIFVIKFDFYRYGEYFVYSVFGFVGLFLDVKLIYFFEVVSFFD